MALLFILLAVFLLVVQFFFLIQLTEVAIHVLGPEPGGFMQTGNPFAWIVGFLMLALAAAAIKWLMKLLNGLAIGVLSGAYVSLTERSNSLSWSAGQKLFSATIRLRGLFALLWLIAAFPITGAVMGFFEHNPQLNGWLSEGSALAYVLVFFGIYGLVYPSQKSSEES